MPAATPQTRLYLAGATLSYIGTAIVPVAISFAVLETGHTPASLGLVLAAQTIPTIILLLLGGIAGDRLPRRHLMIAADLFRAAAQTLLATALILNHAPLALMVAASAAIGIGNAFFQPASGAFLTEITPRDQLARANGLLRTANALAMVIGPALGGTIVATIGPGWGIALDAASYIASAACLLAIHPPGQPGPTPSTKKSAIKDLRESFQTMRKTKWLLLMVAQYGALNMFAIAPFNVIAPVLLAARSTTASAGAAAWGTILSAIGLGAVAGALACARHQPRRLLLGVQAAATLLAAPLFLLAIHAPFPLIVAGGAAFGISAAVLSVLTITAIQEQIAPAMLARIMAIVQLANIGLLPVGYLLAGPTVTLLGAPISLALSGACVLGSVAILSVQKEIREFRQE